jgi:uncharacterized membrane protein YcjF (UPF0283 family)
MMLGGTSGDAARFEIARRDKRDALVNAVSPSALMR